MATDFSKIRVLRRGDIPVNRTYTEDSITIAIEVFYIW